MQISVDNLMQCAILILSPALRLVWIEILF
nr:MAG TPA: hypothetical protein [Caudoviricetes sp.]